MKPTIKILSIMLFFSSLLAFTACTDDDNTGDNTGDSDSVSNFSEINDENLTFYLIPSPKDMFAFTKKGDLAFSAEVLNPKDNTDKYIDTKSQELGFGIYSADLAYTASFSQTNEATEYLKIVRDLSDKIGISAIFDESLVKRFDNIPANKDSLIRITNDTYYDIVRFLEENERKSTLALLSTGGWLESLYIVINLRNNYSEDDNVIQLIADQKNIFENLILYLEQHNSEKSIKDVIKELKPIKNIYDELEVVKIETPDRGKKKKNQIVVGGATKIVITEAQFKKLKETITKVRNKFAAGNV